ncbi:single-stranded DNA exonuclease RecJ [Helicobacter muridarum]|uniref:Single-stranded-DNA-specific exonuclease RecJ n=1 Tax=Helicobacter muridarum TaxID=216 RepID=A0A377PXC5_9HELI|nr:DHH family phosphoesterase [Helicobacter muridarum]TLD98918.1 single-stranded DNA exonuclease RecJ [Helicobacter muridarum]STQ87114.1 single-stranded-DNA-specific exonuclease [Helicobacter muridarum]
MLPDTELQNQSKLAKYTNNSIDSKNPPNDYTAINKRVKLNKNHKSNKKSKSGDKHFLHSLYNNPEAIQLKKTLRQFSQSDEIKILLDERFKDYPFVRKLSKIPHPSSLLNNMDAARLACEVIANNKKIVIVGDYDADGICATCTMLDFFDAMGYKNISFAIPNRFKHGYGFSRALFEEIVTKHEDVALIITVDNGVSSFEAAKLCKMSNIKLIITDHHTLEVDNDGNIRVPDSDFMINPQQEACTFQYKDICGALVAWYFCYAIKILIQGDVLASFNSQNPLIKFYEKNLCNTSMKTLLLFVSIAIISDVMPLDAINYTICDYGLSHLKDNKSSAFLVVVEYFKCLIDSQMLGFKFIPLLNAAGRIDDGTIALDFLRSQSIAEAKSNFNKLKELNNYRKELQEQVARKAFKSLRNNVHNSNICFAVGHDWHEGVLGIVAGKMADEFGKPSFVLTNINGVCKGSGRSDGDVDLIASMHKVGHLFSRYGGHVGAVGLEISEEHIDEFLRLFRPVYLKRQSKYDLLGILPLNLVNRQTLLHIESHEPYGNGNSIPKFFFELEILRFKRTNHGFLEFYLIDSNSDTPIKAMFFNTKYMQAEFVLGDILQFSATLSINSQYFNRRYGFQQAYSISQVMHIFCSEDEHLHSRNKEEIMLIIDKIHGICKKTI